MKILAIIPARFASTRFPGKPLVIIQGMSMIQRVYEQVKKCSTVDEVVVATDDERIEQEVKRFHGRVIMTASSHQSGTERCGEVIGSINELYDVIINIQGDEPFIDPVQIDLLGGCFMNNAVDIATLIKRITTEEEVDSPHIVKVAVGEQQQALYFSRSAIPYHRNLPVENWHKYGVLYKHIGIYAYRTSILHQLVQLPVNNLEQAESLEQLRWLANGYSIHTAITTIETIAIDTPDDLKKL